MSAVVCTVCGKSFGRRPDLNRHAKIHNPNALRFHCDYPGCTHSSLQKSNLKAHHNSKHLQTRHHKGRFKGCTMSYGDASALIKHEKTIHDVSRKEQTQVDQLSSMENVASKLEAPSPSPAAFLDPIQDAFIHGQSTEAFLHEILPEFFPHPRLKFMQDSVALENPYNESPGRFFE